MKIIRVGRDASLSALCLALLSACGGGGGGESNSGSNEPTKNSISGVVANGYLSGAAVCLDLNADGRCGTGEPATVSGVNGAYQLNNITAGDESKYPILVEVPASAVDADTGKAVGKPFFLKSPAGHHAFVSPLTTLVQAQIEAGKTTIQAEQIVRAELGKITDANLGPYSNYLAGSNTADYANLHAAAGIVAATVQNAYQALEGEAGRLGVQRVLAEVAMDTLRFQKNLEGGFSVSKGLGTQDNLSSLKRRAAALNEAQGARQAVSIRFAVKAGDQAVACGLPVTLSQTVDHTSGATQITSGQVADLRFYVSNIALIDAQGKETFLTLDENDNQSQDVALLDFEDASGLCSKGTPATYTTLTGTVKAGTYVGLSMTLGVPIKTPKGNIGLNHSDTVASSTPVLLQPKAMAWSWQGGRKFTKIEFTPEGGKNWTVHLGSTGCQGTNPANGEVLFCTNPNRVDYVFKRFNPATEQVVLDLNELFRGSDVAFNTAGTAAGCMSATNDPECAAIFKSLGLDLPHGMTLTDATQKTFALRSLTE